VVLLLIPNYQFQLTLARLKANVLHNLLSELIYIKKIIAYLNWDLIAKINISFLTV